MIIFKGLGGSRKAGYMMEEDPVQEARAPERLFRVQMDWAQCCGKFKESQHESDLHLKG